jgi:hypothetical protein
MGIYKSNDDFRITDTSRIGIRFMSTGLSGRKLLAGIRKMESQVYWHRQGALHKSPNSSVCHEAADRLNIQSLNSMHYPTFYEEIIV